MVITEALKEEGWVHITYIVYPNIESLLIATSPHELQAKLLVEVCSEAIFGNLGAFKSCHFWQLLFPKVAKNGNFAKEVLPFLATFMQCLIFHSNSGNP